MTATSAATIPSPSGPPVRPRTSGASSLLACALLCCAWSIADSRAWAIDVDELLASENRDNAARELQQAQANLQQARAEAAAARKHLDAFLSRHFQELADGRPSHEAQRPGPRGQSVLRPDPKLARLQIRLEELRAQRLGLLDYLNHDHPQVLDVDERIADIQLRITGVAVAPDAQALAAPAPAEQRWVDPPSERARERDAAEYRRLYEAWQSAEYAVDEAIEVQTSAARQLEFIAPSELPAAQRDDGPAAASAAAQVQVEPSPSLPVAEPSAAPSETDTAGSQPLALAALLIALAVAALAAVRLARSTVDPLFASADEVAAALAIPVVGIIPATAARAQRVDSDSSWRRSWILLGEILMAFAVFCATVYVLQNPGGAWQLFAHPLETLSSMARAITTGN